MMPPFTPLPRYADDIDRYVAGADAFMFFFMSAMRGAVTARDHCHTCCRYCRLHVYGECAALRGSAGERRVEAFDHAAENIMSG